MQVQIAHRGFRTNFMIVFQQEVQLVKVVNFKLTGTLCMKLTINILIQYFRYADCFKCLYCKFSLKQKHKRSNLFR